MIVIPSFVLERRSALSKSPSWKESGLVFTTDIGTPISPRSILRHFKDHIKKANLRDIRFHDLRHTAASFLLEKNVNSKLVSEVLGHSSVDLTLNTYSHVINSLNKVADCTLNGLVGRR